MVVRTALTFSFRVLRVIDKTDEALATDGRRFIYNCLFGRSRKIERRDVDINLITAPFFLLMLL